MAKIDLGRVVGENGGFGNVRSTYISDGGMPSVGIEASGPDTAKDFDFIFSNIVNDPMTDEEIDGIVDGQYSQSSDVLNGRGLSRLWNWICELFAPKEHKHSASDLDSGTIDAARIANGTITKDMLDKTLGDSLSRLKPKDPALLADGELAALTIEGRSGAVYVLTAYEDGIELYDRAAMRRVWKLLK